MDENKLVIYQTEDGGIELKTDIKNETIWANQKDMAHIFGVNTQAITKHLRNIYAEEELNKEETCSIMEQVQKEGDRTIKRQVEHYNLDAVIAVGYRINSILGTKFRQWATNKLKSYVVKGYILNEKKLHETQDKLQTLKATINFMQEKSKTERLTGKESEILNLLGNYAKTLTLLQAYDNGNIPNTIGTKVTFKLTYEICTQIITEIKKELIAKDEAGDLFDNERTEGWEGIISNLYQTFAGKELYPTTEDKTANLLYLIIKDHPFSDGNKRIASFLFIYYLDKNQRLYKENGEKRINDNALTALALLVAESDPKEKDLLISIIKSLLTD